MIKIIAFYKYVDIENPHEFCKKHMEECTLLNLKGRILVATEGINGSVSGEDDKIEAYKNLLIKDKRFSDIEFKEDKGIMHPFKKMQVKIKPELVRFEQDVDYKDAGTHISPNEFLKKSKNKDVIILDARNNYESRVGKFKNALTPDIKTFRDFPKVLESLNGNEEKEILMYCTGGIRCEKASAFLKKNGFKKVYQLHGGILNFGKELPDTIWEGKCFVFDKRMVSSINSEENPISLCDLCGVQCDLYKNCRNEECDKLSVICLQCQKNFSGCCSPSCFSSRLIKSQALNMN